MRKIFIIAVLLFASVCFADQNIEQFNNAQYFNARGNEISAEEYQRVCEEHQKLLFQIKQPNAEMEEYQKSSKGKKIKSVGREVKSKKIPTDYLGRPLRDSKGRWITYSEDEKRGSSYGTPNSVTTSTKSYQQNSSSARKMWKAQEADKYRERYLKSGKTTDLLRYQEAFKEAIK